MILRLSQKLAKKIKVAPTKSYPLDDNPYADWSAHLFTANRAQYVLATNSASLYSLVFPGRGITDTSQLLDRLLSSIGEVMVEDGLEKQFSRHVAPSAHTVTYSKALNRSVTGSMNDLVLHSQYALEEVGLSPLEVTQDLNGIPFSALKYRFPRQAVIELEETL